MTAHDWSTPDLLLPERARLLHIGPHKTGTTALQDAFVLARHRVAEHGVYFSSGKYPQPMRPALAAIEQPTLRGEARPDQRHWDRFTQNVADAGDQRVMISSEFFADARQEQAATVVDRLGGQDVQVVITLRPLSKIFPSQWQQYVQNGLRLSYDTWLHRMLNEPPGGPLTPTFWHRHDHPALVERWSSVVGRDRVTVVVVDESDRTMLLRVFESLLGLPDDLLQLDTEVSNRSMTWGEVELLRRLNVEFHQQGWPNSYYSRFLRRGGIERMRKRHVPAEFETKIVTPAWAEERAAQLGEQFAEHIDALGVRVVGDTAALARASTGGTEAPEPILSAQAAAEAVTGTIIAGTAGQARSKKSAPTKKQTSTPPQPKAKRPTRVEERLVANVRTVHLLRVVAKRVRKRVARRLGLSHRPATLAASRAARGSSAGTSTSRPSAPGDVTPSTRTESTGDTATPEGKEGSGDVLNDQVHAR